MALVVPVPAPAGASVAELLHLHRYNIAQANALARAGAAVELFADAPEASDHPLERGARLLFRPRPPGLGVKLAGAALVARAAARPELTALHLFHALDTRALAAAALAPVPVFAEYNGGAPPRALLRRAVMARAADRLRGLFFTARALALPFVEAGALSGRARLFAVPELSSLLPITRDRAAARARLGIDGASPVVLSVARIATEKAPLLLLEAFRALRRHASRALLLVAAGRDELGGVFERTVAGDDTLRGAVRLRYGVPPGELPDWYAASDVLLLPSLRETCGAAFIEGLAAGVPIAATELPAFAALGRTAAVRLVPQGDAAGLASAALELASGTGARDAARARFERALSYDAIAARKLAIYRRAPVGEDY